VTIAHKRLGLGAALILGAGTLLALTTSTTASAITSSSGTPAAPPCTISAQQVNNSARAHHPNPIGGVIVATGTSTSTGACHKPPPEPAFNGLPPLLFHGSPAVCTASPCFNGNVMMTASTGPLVVVPIFWDPTGFPMSSSYKNIILSYLGDVAKASGKTKNVFSILNEYFGNNGQINYNVQLGSAIEDTNPITSSCTLEAADTTGIYADGSGYSACVDDAQLQAEVDRVSAAAGLPHDLSHIYVLYLSKHVESCILPGQTIDPSNGQACTINYEPTAAYCAYHSADPASAVYANMPYAIYASPVGFTCGSDARFPVIQSPNGNPDADTEISPTSHEINESITDPDTQTGWYDQAGFENGDECAYIFGRTRGAPDAFFNQVINGGHFLTQEEFSNKLFASSGGTAGCLQGA
jgi:hypothetical protein